MLHKNATLGDAHFAHTWEYADSTARAAATGFVSTDVKKLALQLSDNTLWVLTATTPTWVQIGNAGDVTLTGTQTLTNKTLTDAKLTQSLNAQTGTTYTFALTDQDKLVTLSNAAAIAATVPPNSSVAFPTGSTINATQLGAGQVTITAGAGVTLRNPTGLKLRAQYSACAITKIAADEWLVIGDTAA